MRRLASLIVLLVAPTLAHAQVLDARAVLDRQRWWDNDDRAWFAERIPIFESPDTAIDATYYYRWELVTKHLTYGSPETGYTFSEFIDRPFWSGAYGAISCPLGHQMDEVRWLNDPRIVGDFARYWFEAPGAQPRSYSNWYGAAVWATYLVNGDTVYLRALLPYMKKQYAGWLAEHWDAGHRMFHWDGLHDGMERSITSRQTDDIDEGADGYRPTLNSYLYADARAIASASRLFGDSATARDYDARADDLRSRVEEELWDERRGFFLHQFAHDEKNGVRALSRTYETGKYAGDPHGREEIGFVPWQFELPEAGKGYERAWRLLMDTSYFFAPYGPTTTERGDPQFYVSPRCCWWSGNSWPYATSQTLTALANVIDDYPQSVVSARDWMGVFEVYTRTQRKDGRPYIAEGANPFTGSWDGFDTFWHSENYFHSSYVDLVVTGLVGLRPRADDSVEVRPLAPDDWPWFALDGVAYHGHRLSILWDRDGTRYHRDAGLTILADGRVIGRSPKLAPLLARLGPPRAPVRARVLRNVAVNNGRGAFPEVVASYSAPANPPFYLLDGSYWYGDPPDRWTTAGSPNARDTVTLDFGVLRSLERVALYLLDDRGTAAVRAPTSFTVELWDGHRWLVPPHARRSPAVPTGHVPNVVTFPSTRASRVRVILVPQRGHAVGMTELEAWSADSLPLADPPASARGSDLAYSGNGATISASFTGKSDRVDEANDLRFALSRYSRNRWTAYGTPNASDWLAVDFGAPKRVSVVELYLWADGGGVKAPKRYAIAYWDGSTWKAAAERSRAPALPQGSALNTVRLVPITTSRLRVVFEHDKPGASGLTEIVVR